MAELERNIKRGNVYWVASVDGWGCATSAGRPGVVISSQFGIDHSPIVTIVYCSTQFKSMSCNVDLKSLDRPSQAQCNQISTVDKNRLGNNLGKITDEEMARIEATVAMCIGVTTHQEELDEAMEALEVEKSRADGLEEELMAKRIEIAMVEKMYDKALEMLAGVKLTKDLQTPVLKKTETVKPKIPRIVDDEPEIDEEIDARITVESNSTGKVNVNTCTSTELHEKTGMGKSLASCVTGYRKKNGPYGSLEDLLKANKFSQYQLDKFRERLTV